MGSLIGYLAPPLVTTEGGKPFPVQEQIPDCRQRRRGNGRSLEALSDQRPREMVILPQQCGKTKLGLPSRPNHQNVPYYPRDVLRFGGK